MQLQEFIDKHYVDGDAYSNDPSISFTCVYQGDEETWGKSVVQFSVYHLEGTEDYFEVTESWSNSGYWDDPDRYDPEFRKVKPISKVVQVTEWVDAD